MKSTLLTLVFAALFVGTARSAAASPKIDGATEETFFASRKILLAALSPEGRFRYAVAESVVVQSLPCGAIREPISIAGLNNLLGPNQISPKACRHELDGKSFDEIVDQALKVNRQDPESMRVPPPHK
jgi:hypothetical protein